MFKNYHSFFRKWKISAWTVLLIAIAILARNISVSDYKEERFIIAEDALHYYAYLPSILVYNDLRLDFVKKAPDEFSDRFWPATAPNGNYVIMTTMGMSMMYAPFVIPVHYFLKVTGQEALGYSPPYRLALVISSLFYGILGLILLRKLLKPWFSDLAIALTLICITFATNLVFYLTRGAAFSHAYSFFLIIWLIYNTSNYYTKPGIGKAILIAIPAALIALVRPTNMVAFMLIPLWNVGSFKALKERLGLLSHQWKHILVFIFTFILMWIPQVIYWKMTSGQYFFNGYGDGGRFFFGNPQFANILLSYRKGWLVYTPVMVVAILGFVLLYRKQRNLFIPIFLYFTINTYVLASWWLWWYGGSFGNRAFIDMYGLLAFPLAAVFHHLLTNRNRGLKIAPFLITAIFVYHNLFQIKQYMNGVLHYISMTKESYWDSFGRLTPSERYYDLLVFPDYEAAKEGRYPKPVVKPKE